MIKPIKKCVTALLLALGTGGTLKAQDTGVSGFFHRAGAALQQSAGNVLHGNTGGNQTNANGVATTTGDLYKPISPNSGGEFVDIFKGVRSGQLWPRVALTFVDYGSNVPCWTVRATIWRSASSKHDETFEICNAPIVSTDAVGNSTTLNPDVDLVWMRQNIQGITHVNSSPDRTTGPSPPQQLFTVPLSPWSLGTQYKNIVFRLAWVSGSLDREGLSRITGQYNLMWTAGFDPAGNHDRHVQNYGRSLCALILPLAGWSAS